MVIEIHVGEAFQLTKSAAKLQIHVEQRVFLGVFAKDVNRPIIWDCSHGRGFAPVRTEIMFLLLWKVKLVPFKRSLAGFSNKDKEKSVKLIPLLNCTSNVDKHKTALAFTDVQNEVELILARARLFSRPQNIDQLKICPHHRETLGLGWKRSSTRCDVPALLSSHSAKVKNRPRAERGLTKLASQTVLNETGIFVPVGSGEFP